VRARAAAAAALVLSAALLLGACGRSAPKSGSPASPGAAVTGTSISISNFMFSPMSITVSPGATISVTNEDSVTHTLSATAHQFDTGDIAQNQTKTFSAPMRPGTYHYICNIHQYMMGTVTVK
jgi:plastocyanin